MCERSLRAYLTGMDGEGLTRNPEAIAAAKDRVVDAARAFTSDSDEIVFRRVDGGENKLAVGFANLKAALAALDELEAKRG